MIRNYLKIAFRNLTKYKFISFINLFGLTIGLTCCLLIFTFIFHELSYDKYQPNADRVYRVTRTFYNLQNNSVSLHLSTISPPFAPYLQNDFKEIEELTRFVDYSPAPVKYGEKMINEKNLFFADDKFFDFFKADVLEGNPKKALSDPYSIMLTDEMAKKYFGNEEPMNKIVRINYGNNDFFTFIRLPKGYDPKKLEKQFPAFLDRRMVGQYTTVKPSQGTSLDLQKVTDIHLRSHTDYEAEENGDIKRVYIFSAIALFILLIACINYMNLSTARSTLRAREIGIRKAVGAQRKEIMAQFLSESILVSWIALILAFGLTWLILPWLNKVSAQNLDINILFKWQVIIPIILVPFIVGAISGLYPAIFMSSFQPVKVLKGFLKTGGGNISFRKVLVTLQFAISIILIICTAIVFNQMRYIQNKSLGYDRDHIVTLSYPSELNDKYDAFHTELLANSNVKNVAWSTRIPTGRLLDNMGASMMSGDTMAPINADIKFVSADHDFIPTYDIKMAAGRNFSREFTTDTSSYLINEAAVQVLGFKKSEDVIGKDFGYGGRNGKLAGVFHDFHFESMHQKIAPMVLFMPRNARNYGKISIKVSGANLPVALSHIENTWRKFLPETPFEYTFLDENFDRLYKTEDRQKTLFTTFACIAIFIACLGLFGLSAFAISQRIKEIGIRKVLGADVSTIVALLSKDFLKLVGISAVIAFPIAWYFMHKWLEDFAYRIGM